ncbi:MAG: SAM-dependent methyltransferase [Myxococcota bacterium]|nr:SAM-dependent methyltransferase [Myxococcota bacterium]
MKTDKPHHILRRTPPERLYPSSDHRIALEEPTSLPKSLEWRLGARYWHHNGNAPFADGSVPYIINNSGWAPRAAAELVLAAGQTISGPLLIVELAAGSGVFARQVLEHIHQESERLSLDVYDRLTWICTDGAMRSVEAWSKRQQFHPHEGHVLPLQLAAADISTLPLPNGKLIGVIANYALDSLPAQVVRRDGTSLHLQACLYSGEQEILNRLGMTVSDIQAEVSRGTPESLDKLMPLLGHLEVQASFRHAAESIPFAEDALQAAGNDTAMVNTGALTFLDGALSRLTDGGFVLINDYGSTMRSEFERQTFVHRFGGTITCALNFPLIDHWLSEHGCRVFKPTDDEQRTIHTRLAILGDNTRLKEAFDEFYNDIQYIHADRVGSWTNSYIASGQVSEALEVLERHLKWCPTDWHKLAEAAQFLMQQFGQLPEALELARAACAVNPWSSTLVWNVYGSVLFSMGSWESAESAWEKAIEIWKEDPSTWLNLSYLYAARGQTEKALTALAKGLAYDRNGGFRAALLQKQSEILGGQYQSHSASIDRMTRRHRRLVDAIRPPSGALTDGEGDPA